MAFGAAHRFRCNTSFWCTASSTRTRWLPVPSPETSLARTAPRGRTLSSVVVSPMISAAVQRSHHEANSQMDVGPMAPGQPSVVRDHRNGGTHANVRPGRDSRGAGRTQPLALWATSVSSSILRSSGPLLAPSSLGTKTMRLTLANTQDACAYVNRWQYSCV